MAGTIATPRKLTSVPYPRAVAWERSDLRNLGIIVLGFTFVLLLVSPVRSYPVLDDWIYSQSVGDLLQLNYAPHDWTQPIALAHLAWGAVFAFLLGHTFTALTISNLVMSIACLTLFYLLLRHLNVGSAHALFGVAVLGFNPLYLFLTYSFMTDITFLALMLAACLFYIRGLREQGEWWLWLGGLACALAYLTRQYGVLVMVAALLYMLTARRWRWRDAIAMSVAPVLAVVAYSVWERFQPSALIAVQMEQVQAAIFRDLGQYIFGRALRVTWLAMSLGLFLVPVLKLPRRPIIALPFVLFLAYFQLHSLQTIGTLFPQNGNLIDITGFIMYIYNSNMVWSNAFWTLLGLAGGVVLSLHLAFLLERAFGWLRSRPWRQATEAQDPALIVYLLGLMLAVVVLALTPFIFDRYSLALLPVLLLVVLRYDGTPAGVDDSDNSTPAARHSRLGNPGRMRAIRWALLSPIAIFSLLAMRDYSDRAAVRWRASESLLAQGARPEQIRAGYEWEGYYDFKAGAKRIRETGDLTNINYPPAEVIDPVYMVSDLPEPGYSEIGSLPYRSWLDGGAERRVLMLKRK